MYFAYMSHFELMCQISVLRVFQHYKDILTISRQRSFLRELIDATQSRIFVQVCVAGRPAAERRTCRLLAVHRANSAARVSSTAFSFEWHCMHAVCVIQNENWRGRQVHISYNAEPSAFSNQTYYIIFVCCRLRGGQNAHNVYLLILPVQEEAHNCNKYTFRRVRRLRDWQFIDITKYSRGAICVSRYLRHFDCLSTMWPQSILSFFRIYGGRTPGHGPFYFVHIWVQNARIHDVKSIFYHRGFDDRAGSQI